MGFGFRVRITLSLCCQGPNHLVLEGSGALMRWSLEIVKAWVVGLRFGGTVEAEQLLGLRVWGLRQGKILGGKIFNIGALIFRMGFYYTCNKEPPK